MKKNLAVIFKNPYGIDYLMKQDLEREEVVGFVGMVLAESFEYIHSVRVINKDRALITEWVFNERPESVEELIGSIISRIVLSSEFE